MFIRRILNLDPLPSDGNGTAIPANLPASYEDKGGDVAPNNVTPSSTAVVVNPDENLADAFSKARSGDTASEASAIHKEPVPPVVPLKTTVATPAKAGEANVHQTELDDLAAKAKLAAEGKLEIPAIELDKKIDVKEPVEPVLPEKTEAGKTADALPKQRDYTIFREEDVPALKKLANKDYAVVAPIAAKLKEQAAELQKATKVIEDNRQGILPPSYLEHESAVVLSPVFNQLQSYQEKGQFEKDYWLEQKNLIKQGKPANMLVLDHATGRYSKGQVIPADTNSESLVDDRLQIANQNLQIVGNQLQQYVGAFQGQVKQSRQVLKNAEDTYFPHFKNPTGHHKETIDKVVAALPEVYRDNPMAGILGKAYATIIELNRQLGEARKGGNTQAAIAEDAKRAGPTALATGGGANAGGNKDTTDDDLMGAFQKARNPER